MHLTDLLLQAGGFSAIVLDRGSTAPAHVSRILLATWFRYGAAAELIAIKSDEPLSDRIDGSLFRDEDGVVYFLCGGAGSRG